MIVGDDESVAGIVAVRALFVNDGLCDLMEVWLVSGVGLNQVLRLSSGKTIVYETC